MTQQKSPWEFRARAWVAFVIYFVGFFAGYTIDGLGGGSGTPTVVIVGRHWGGGGIRVALLLAGALTVAGFLLRWWGSSYHRAGVVFSARIETDTLTAAGPYRYVRNPLYLGNILQAIGISSVGPPAATIIIIVTFTAFLYRLIFLEEAYLQAAQGEAYARYCAAVPRLVPRLTPANIPPGDQRPNAVYGFVTELGTFGFAVWMSYVALAAPRAPTAMFYILLYSAAVLFVLGGVLSRRMSAGTVS